MTIFIKLIQQMGLYGLIRNLRRWLAPLSPQMRQQNKSMMHFYQQMVKPEELCFDVGANIGERTAVFLKLGAKVLAVEPQPKCVQILKQRFGKKQQFALVPEAVGAAPGEAEMMLSDADMISSLSKEWIEQVKTSGRFKNYEWTKSIKVPITTLDQLIETFGKPVFCKIDVEGYEDQVLQGLTQPVDMLSFEFTPEYVTSTIKCIDHLNQIGKVEFNLSIGESMTYASDQWMSAKEMKTYMEQLPDKSVFGDVYARFKKAEKR